MVQLEDTVAIKRWGYRQAEPLQVCMTFRQSPYWEQVRQEFLAHLGFQGEPGQNHETFQVEDTRSGNTCCVHFVDGEVRIGQEVYVHKME